MALYDKYGDHILGVISDVRFPVAGRRIRMPESVSPTM